MSNFSCPVVQIAALSPISDAERIEHARILGCDVIVPRPRYRAGDRAVYVPPGSVLPSDLAESLKGTVKLFGERRNRVEAFQLRGAFSEGILIGPLPGAAIGSDGAGFLGITKYEPPPPLHWRGQAVYLPHLTVPYDIESLRRHPRILVADEVVEITEKLHGTLCAIGYMPGVCHPDLIEGDTAVYSKTLGRFGRVLKAGNEANLYIRTARRLMMREVLKAAFNGRPATAFGEIYGSGIQDLTYGRENPEFALFDIYLGIPGNGRWLDRTELAFISGEIAPRVPVLFSGVIAQDTISKLSRRRTTAGFGVHISEGTVITPMRERQDRKMGRVILKYVSPEYLTRADATEFN